MFTVPFMRVNTVSLGARLWVVGVATLLAAFSVLILAVRAGDGLAAGTTVTVRMTEFKFALSKTSIKKGRVVFKVVNRGAVPHDFKIKGKKTPIIAPGKSRTLTVTFTRAGRYPYLCAVPGHAASGMKGALRVR
jgi:uncharacterized cupredoxin-like copper-binding protein